MNYNDYLDKILTNIFRNELLKNTYRNENRKYTAKEVKDFGKVYYQEDNTVLKIGNDTFVAVPEKGDKFDAEKGLLICVAKAMGLTTTDILKLKDNAVHKNSKKKKKVVKQDKAK